MLFWTMYNVNWRELSLLSFLLLCLLHHTTLKSHKQKKVWLLLLMCVMWCWRIVFGCWWYHYYYLFLLVHFLAATTKVQKKFEELKVFGEKLIGRGFCDDAVNTRQSVFHVPIQVTRQNSTELNSQKLEWICVMLVWVI